MPQTQTVRPEAAANAEDRLREAMHAAEARSAEDQAALERVRRKLTRLMLVSLIITFIALAVVVIAVIYKITHSAPKAALAAAPAPAQAAELSPEQQAAARLHGALIQTAPNSGADAYFAKQKQEAEAKAAAESAEPAASAAVKNLSLPLAAGERVVSSSLSGAMLLLQTEGGQNGGELLIYDLDKGRLRARLSLSAPAQ